MSGFGSSGRSVMMLALVGAATGSLAWSIVRTLSRRRRDDRSTRVRGQLQANARNALAMKRSRSKQESPSSRTAGEGMRSIPNTGIAPSGAFNQEGHRPVLERSRKVR